MKKILLLFLLAAVSLQGWADEYYLVGGATPTGWTSDVYHRSPGRATQTGANTYAWAGKLKAYDSSNEDGTRFKIPIGNNYNNGIWASEQNQHLTETPSTIESANNGDKKFCVSEEGYYLVSFNTSTSTITAKKLKEPSKDGDYYLISSTDDYYWFAGYIASNDTKTAKARLNADISFEGKDFVCLASDKYKFKGEFDGNGHTIDYAVVQASSYGKVGLFTYLADEAYVHDLVIGEHSFFKGDAKVGGIAGFARDGGEVTLTNVINKASVQATGSTDANAAGLIACATDNTIITALNCANTGNVSGQADECAALAGWTQDNGKSDSELKKSTFTNCWNIGEINNIEGTAQLYRNSDKVTANNCYDLTATGDQGTKLDAGAAASGELAIMLNARKTSGSDWYQTVGTDTHPFPFSSPSHAELTLTPTDSWYEISQPWQLRWMAESVNEHNSTYKNANIKLTANIDYSAYTDQAAMIGKPSNTYKGVFDGQNKTVTVAFTNNTAEETGLFRRVNGGTIKNLKVGGSITTNQKYTGGICSGIWETGTIKNCESAVTITDNTRGTNTDVYHGGILARVSSLTSTGISVENCLFSGTITAPKCTSCAGIVSQTTTDDSEKGYMHIKNNLVAGTLNFENNEKNGVIVSKDNKADFDNNYYACTVGTNIQKANATDASSYKTTGELCYKLNKDTNAGKNWYQNLSENKDEHPFPFNTQGTVSKSNTSYTNLTVIDDYVQINEKEDLYTFSAEVSNGQTTLNAELKDDIVTDNSYTPIGTGDNKYKGNFNGNKHIVTLAINDNTRENQGLIGVATTGANIHDLVVDGSVTAKKRIAGIVGYATGGGTITLTNVINKANVDATGNDQQQNAAGLVGCGDGTAIIAKNCANMGSVKNSGYTSGTQQCAAFAGWTTSGTTFTNCWNSGTISNYENTAILYRNTGQASQENCYHVTDDDFTPQYGTKIGTITVTSGELCYKLNGSANAGTDWYQTLGTDNYPVPFDTHEKIYYVDVEKCDGSGTGEQIYNNSASVVLPHEYEEGWCSICNEYQENAISANDGWYEISEPWQLRWMAESVNEHNSTYKNANIKLTANIDYSAYTNQAAMIGKEGKTYKGTFDGQFHTVTVAFNNTSADETGLVQRMNGGTIKNLRVDGTISTDKKLAAGICSGIWQTGTITNCWSNVTITDEETGDATHGGIVAHVKDNTNVNITHCLFSGEINAPNRTGSGALVGWADSENDNIKINHCLVVGDIDLKGNSDNDIVCRRNATTSDNYYTCDISKVNNNRGAINACSYVAGELCYLLNESTCYDVNWTQTLGTDTYPVPFNTHGIVNKMSAAGYTTQYIPTTDVTIPTGVEAYTGVILSEGWLHLNAIENGKIAAGEAVILKGNEGYYSFVPTTDAEEVEGNVLKGSDGTITGGDGIYALAKKGNPAVVGFYSVDSDVPVPAGKVYLDSDGSLVKVFKFAFDDDDATGINSPLLTSPEEEGQVYNLAGQRISKLQKGINIINGKKVLK